MGINATYIQGYASSITGIINSILVPVLISIAFIVFIYGIYNYFIAGASDEKKRSEGKTFALYGIIGFVVLFSVWGIVNIFIGTLGLTASNAPSFPTIGGSTGTNSPLPVGTSGLPSFPGAPSNSATNATQSGAYSALQQQYASLQANCPSGYTSASCQQQLSSYQQALNSYNATYPSSGSTGTTCTGENGNSGTCRQFCNSNEEIDNGSTACSGVLNCCVPTSSAGEKCDDSCAATTCSSDKCTDTCGNEYDGKLNCDNGSGGLCVPQDCSATTCAGDMCTDTCGNEYKGTMDCSSSGASCVRDDSYAASTCAGDQFIDNCGIEVLGTMDCSGQ